MAQQGGPPVYVLLTNPAKRTVVAWARVREIQEVTRGSGEKWSVLRLEKHPFPAPVALAGNTTLANHVAWLRNGVAAAFKQNNVQEISGAEFAAFIAAARQDGLPPAGLPAAFAEMRRDPRWQFQIQLRRTRAAQLRTLLAVPEAVTLDLFNHEVWVFSSKTLLRGKDIGPTGIAESVLLAPDQVADLQRGLETGELELHGNYLWGSAARVYGAQLTSAGVEEKTGNIRRALSILNNPSLAPIAKAEQIEAITGFGRNSSTGLVMVFHPAEFAIYNQQSQAAMEKLGYQVGTLAEFEDVAHKLKDAVGAEDYLELDLFLWLVNNNQISMGVTMSLIDAAYATLQEEEGDPLSLSDLLQRAGQKGSVGSGQMPSLTAFRSALLQDARFAEASPNLWKLAESPGPVSIVDSGIWRIHLPREYWREARAAGVIAIEWPPDSTNRSVQAFKRIKVGDRVVAYVQGGTIGGLGRVTRAYYDVRETPDGNQALFGGNLPQRIGVEWADALPEPVDLLDVFRRGEQAALYNRLKNPHTVIPLAPEYYQTLLQLLGLPGDPFDDEEPQLPTAWARLATYAEFASGIDANGEPPDAILARARAVDRITDTDLNPSVDADDLVEQLRQFRLLASTENGGYKPQAYVTGDPAALLRLMALALLVREAGAAGGYMLPARTILAGWSADQPATVESFAPVLSRTDAARLFDWYVEAGLVAREGQTWQPMADALQPVAGTDPASRTYNEFLSTLQEELAGTLHPDLPPADGPLPAATDFEAGLRELGEDLLFDTAVVRRIYRSLRAGRHVILSGPPGTGKTELAKRLPHSCGGRHPKPSAAWGWI
jgi:hypothetical protein